MTTAKFTWSKLIPPSEGLAAYHLSISRRDFCPVEDYQLHIYRFPGQDTDDWHLAIHHPLLETPGQLAEFRNKYRGRWAARRRTSRPYISRVLGCKALHIVLCHTEDKGSYLHGE